MCSFCWSNYPKSDKCVLNKSSKCGERLKETGEKSKLAVDTVTAVEDDIKGCCQEMGYNLTGSKENNELKTQQGR